MMKRILSLILSLMLLAALLPACAETAEVSPLYRIVHRTEAGDVYLGTGVLFASKNLLLTAAGCCSAGESLYAIGEDGEHVVTYTGVITDTGVALVGLATESAAEPVGLTNSDQVAQSIVQAVDGEGKALQSSLLNVRMSVYNGREAVLLTVEDAMPLGAVMLGEDGGVACMTVAQYSESHNTYTTLMVSVLAQVLLDATAEEDAQSEWLEPALTWENGYFCVDWSEQAREDGVYSVALAAKENAYYSAHHVSDGVTSMELALPPGHTYVVLVQWAADDDALQSAFEWKEAVSLAVPAAEFTGYEFTQQCWLAGVKAGEDVTGRVLPEWTGMTAASLMDEGMDYYLQIRNTYAVSEELSMALSLEMIAPDGQVYYEQHSYLFDPAIAADDSFAMPLDDLLASCAEFSEGGVLQSGAYTIRYSIGGGVAGTVSFTLE
ncbi:MAG: hypothetical protein IJZ74_09050 [Clostridia bacterium]|nr:hypothetical protein [Clostridia bacterium]